MNNRQAAVTLVEVLAALVLLATVISGFVVAQCRSLEQLAALRDKARGADLARELIHTWRIDSASSHIPLHGNFEQAPGWSWTRSTGPARIALHGPVHEIRVTVHKRMATAESAEIVSLAWLEKQRNVERDGS